MHHIYVYARPRALLLSLALLLVPQTLFAATLSLTPANASVNTGDVFTITVRVSSSDQAMNASSGELSFPTDLLRVSSVSKGNSVLTLWVQDPAYSNNAGTIDWSGVVPNPGYSGSGGPILNVTFVAKKAGAAQISFASSAVLANDGNGTNILLNANPTTISINSASTPQPAAPTLPPQTQLNEDLLAHITSSTHPDQTQWYKLSHAVFDWTNAQGVSAIRLGYDENAGSNPTVLYSDPISHKELDLTDGIWYFYAQERGLSGWGPVSAYRVQIDTVPPQPFIVTFLNGTTTTKVGSTIAIQFATQDELSGIDHYQVVIDGKELIVSAEEGSKPYAISGDLGAHSLLVRAYDKARNMESAEEKKFLVIGEEIPRNTLFSFGWLAVNYLSLILMALAVFGTLLFAAWYIHVHFSAYRYRLRRQLGLTHAHIHKEFDKLKDAITEELLKLEQVKSERALTREEERLISRLKKLLDQSEREIESDIENIQK